MKAAVLTVFKELMPLDRVRDVVAAFEEGVIADVGEDVPSAELAALVNDVPALRTAVQALTGGDESPAATAAAIQFVLEGLHLSKRLKRTPPPAARARRTAAVAARTAASAWSHRFGECQDQERRALGVLAGGEASRWDVGGLHQHAAAQFGDLRGRRVPSWPPRSRRSSSRAPPWETCRPSPSFRRCWRRGG